MFENELIVFCYDADLGEGSFDDIQRTVWRNYQNLRNTREKDHEEKCSSGKIMAQQKTQATKRCSRIFQGSFAGKIFHTKHIGHGQQKSILHSVKNIKGKMVDKSKCLTRYFVKPNIAHELSFDTFKIKNKHNVRNYQTALSSPKPHKRYQFKEITDSDWLNLVVDQALLELANLVEFECKLNLTTTGIDCTYPTGLDSVTASQIQVEDHLRASNLKGICCEEYVEKSPRNSPNVFQKFLRMMSCHETDPVVIARREKQIAYGKSTDKYKRYISSVPYDLRDAKMPQTPKINKKYSRRQFDSIVKNWKFNIHEWDRINE